MDKASKLSKKLDLNYKLEDARYIFNLSIKIC
jgi:hypothetical protein